MADNVVLAVMVVGIDVAVVARMEESTGVHPTNPTIMHETQILVSHNFFLNIIPSYLTLCI